MVDLWVDWKVALTAVWRVATLADMMAEQMAELSVAPKVVEMVESSVETKAATSVVCSVESLAVYWAVWWVDLTAAKLVKACKSDPTKSIQQDKHTQWIQR